MIYYIVIRLNYLHILDGVEVQDWSFIIALHRPRLQVLSRECWCYLVAWLSSQLNCCTCLLLFVRFWHYSRPLVLQWLSTSLFELKEGGEEYIFLVLVVRETSGPGLLHLPFSDIPCLICLSWNCRTLMLQIIYLFMFAESPASLILFNP